jgi:hypothetical protein
VTVRDEVACEPPCARERWEVEVSVAEVFAVGGADAGPMLRLSTISFFSDVSIMALDFIGLRTMAPTKCMSVYWRRKCKKSCPRHLCAAETGT